MRYATFRRCLRHAAAAIIYAASAFSPAQMLLPLDAFYYAACRATPRLRLAVIAAPFLRQHAPVATPMLLRHGAYATLTLRQLCRHVMRRCRRTLITLPYATIYAIAVGAG